MSNAPRWSWGIICGFAALTMGSATAQSPIWAAALTPAKGAAPSPRLPIPEDKGGVLKGHVLLRLSPDHAAALDRRAGLANSADSPAPVQQTFAGVTLRYVSRVGPSGWTWWATPAGANPEALATRLGRDPQVSAAQAVNLIHPLLDLPGSRDADVGVLELREDCYFVLDEESWIPFNRTWNLDTINAMDGWGIYPNRWYTAANKPVNAPTIAIIDTGCEMNHPDFRNQGGTSTNVTQGGQLDWSRSRQFRLGRPVVGGDVNDTNGHGTHVAGLALAGGANTPYADRGMIGVGYNSQGMILRVFDDNGTGTDADAAAALYFAADNGAHVANLSLGTTNYSQILQDAVTYAFQKGVVVVAATNESGAGPADLGPIYPAACAGVVAVTATGELRDRSFVASTGSYIDIAAPGGSFYQIYLDGNARLQFVYSTSPNRWVATMDNPLYIPAWTMDYAYAIGTSMAAPHVAGALGLYAGQHNLSLGSWNNVRAMRALYRSAVGDGTTPYGTWGLVSGYGHLDLPTLLTESVGRETEVGSVSGQVMLGRTAQANVTVEAVDSTGFRTSTTTNANGYYRFEALPQDVYTVTAFPLDQEKAKRVRVLLGSETEGVNFWVGNVTFDTTAPVVDHLTIQSATPTLLTLKHWAYDPETGLDWMRVRIGTSAGAQDVLAEEEVVLDGPTFGLTGFGTLAPGTYHLRASYKNGGSRANGIVSVDRTFTIAGTTRTVSGQISLGDFGGTVTGRSVTLELRTPGTSTVLETKTVTLAADGSFSFTTSRTGTVDLTAKASHWLRARRTNVALSGTSVTGQNFTLINGDVDGDNAVTVFDYDALSAAFDTSAGQPGWNPEADLDGDGSVTVFDYDILSGNFDREGTP